MLALQWLVHGYGYEITGADVWGAYDTLLTTGARPSPADHVAPEEIKDPYALDGLPNKVLAAEYRTTLPTERILVQEIEKTRRQIEDRRRTRGI